LIKSKKAIVAVVLTLIVVLVATMNNINRKVEAQQLIDIDKFVYALSLDFGFRIVIDGHTYRTASVAHLYVIEQPDPFYTDLVFVHSRTEAEGFPDNIVVAWPTVGGGQAAVRMIQWVVGRTEAERNRFGFGWPALTLEQFGLTQPLTVEDLVDNWENVNALLQALSSAELNLITHFAQRHKDFEAEGYIIERDAEGFVINFEHPH